ncbi:GNAT family N-acetyltransferase [uncultured Roseibium sp.]|uniref:GNAT family N-acetyltransferase n=1 Tax=uncultured Roseibium sp. TaxID=1936171 RepID=UPI002595C832|nr:GNAT family N-acetyltransferase [uncultured Roseibium sp.]
MTHTGALHMRRADAGDAPALADLADRAYRDWIDIIGSKPQPMGADYDDLIDKDEVWMTGPRGMPEGSLVLRREDDHLLLWSIAVSPGTQGTGLGNRLLDFTLARARNLSFSEVRLFTNMKMQSNRDWYARKGFREAERKMIGTKRVVIMTRSV